MPIFIGINCIILGIYSYFDKTINPNVFWYWMIMATIWFASTD